SYNFFTNSDDGSKLFIGSTLVVDNDGLHGDQQKSGTIGLKKGLHTIKVTFFERNGGEVLNVRYEGVNIAKQLVPDTILFRASSSIRVAASDEMFLGQDVSFYPNPTSQDIHIETVNGDPVYEVVFLNALGNTVKEVHNGNSKLTINISDLDFGVYTVQIKTIANVITKKLRVE
ncbi:MAG TPA: T9SS type A sorting domain-containing protein, partial [Cytophagaceae bacterium]